VALVLQDLLVRRHGRIPGATVEAASNDLRHLSVIHISVGGTVFVFLVFWIWVWVFDFYYFFLSLPSSRLQAPTFSC